MRSSCLLRFTVLFLSTRVAATVGAQANGYGTPGTVPASHLLTASRAATPPLLDGRDADVVWRTAERRADFRTFSPRENGDPAFATELAVAHDDRALYIFVRAFDPRPDSIVRLLSRRDTDGAPNDQIQLFIDSFHDRRNGFEYIVNAAGVKSDYLLFDDTGFDQSWDGVWEVATHIDSLGWSAEFAIPLQQLRFTDRRSPVFGIMVWRLVGRTGERVSWPDYRPSRSGYVSQTGTLRGVRDLVRGASLEASPYAMARARNRSRESAQHGTVETEVSLGGDVRYLPRPNVSLDATFNPDFGQVESDPAVLDLTGFEVFQSERRPFFLEGAGQLTLPLANDGSGTLFHSRRIGRAPALAPTLGGSDAPTETTIHAAAKLTARLPRATSVVLLSAVTAEEEGAQRPSGGQWVIEPRSHYGVARVQRDFRAGRSGIGLMATSVERARGDSATTAWLPRSATAVALTAQHQTMNGNYRVSGWLAGSDVRGSATAIRALQLSNVHGFQQPDDGISVDPNRTTLRGGAAHLFAGKVAGGITRYDASYRWISPAFDVNEIGFLMRSGVQGVAVSAGLRATRAGELVGIPYRAAALTLSFAGDWSTAGLAFARGASLSGTTQLANQSQVQVTLAQQVPGAYCTMSCTRGGPTLVDAPRSRIALDLTGDPRRPLVPHANAEWFRDDEGRSRGLAMQADVLWRARSNVDASLAVNASEARNDAVFYQRSGDPLSDTSRVTVARLAQPIRSITARVDYTVTTTLSLQWYSQAYVARGAYSSVRELDDPRAGRYDDRFQPVAEGAVATGPTGVDFRQFRSNAVLRWEYRAGSTLFVVWTQGRRVDALEPGILRFGPDLRDLFRRRPENRLAVKLSYWLSR